MKYYTCANTSGGVTDFTEENVFDVEYKVKLICENSYIKSLFLGFFCIDKDYCEKIMKMGSTTLKDGIVLRRENFAIAGNVGAFEKVIDLDVRFGKPESDNEVYHLCESMFSCYTDAKAIHDEWEGIYIENMDFSRLNAYCDGLIERFACKKSSCGSGKTYKRFFGTSTIDGPKNYIDNLTFNMEKRCFIKGRPGTGKSTFLKKLSAKLKENGFDTEEYYCSFDSNSLDMVICRELSLSVFDSTSPHEKFPQRESDEILDFYTESGLCGVDEKYERELFFVKSAYDNKIKEAMHYFKKAWILKDEQEKQHFATVSESDIRKIVNTEIL